MTELQKMQRNYALLAEALEDLGKQAERIKCECERLALVCQCGADPRNSGDQSSGQTPLDVPDDWDWVHGVHPTSRSQQ